MKRMIATLTGLLLATAVNAAELTLISGGAVEPGVHAAVHAFEKATGHKVKVTFNTTPQMQKRISAGDVFDVASRKIIATLKDETGAAVQSEKMLEIDWRGTEPILAGDQFGVGRVTK